MIENYSNTQDLTAAIISHFPKYDHHFHEHFMNDVCNEVAFVATIAHCLKKMRLSFLSVSVLNY